MLSDVRLLRPSTRAVLDGGKYTALIRADGQFELYDFFFDTLSLDCTLTRVGFCSNDIAPGSYLLEIQSADFIFPKVRLPLYTVARSSNNIAQNVTGAR